MIIEKKRQGTKRRWDSDEVNTFSTFFSSNIKNKKMALGQDIAKACALMPNRTTAQIRSRLNNIIKDKQKIKQVNL